MAGALKRTPVREDAPKQQASLGQAIGQPEKGRRFEGESQSTPKEKTKGVPAKNVDEVGPRPGSAPPSPMLRPVEPRKLIFRNRRLFDTWREVLLRASGNMDLNEVRRVLQAEPLCFQEEHRNGKYMYTRLARDGYEPGTLCIHEPNSENCLPRHILNDVKSDCRKEFGWTAETFVFEEEIALD